MNVRRSLLLVLLVLASAGTVWGLQVWMQKRSETAFEDAWIALKNEGRVRPAQEFAAAYESSAAFRPHCTLLRGALALKGGDHAEAYEILCEVEPLPSIRQRLTLLLGECLYHAGELARAEQAFRQAADENPDSVEAHRWLAINYHDIGAMSGAMGELKEVIRLKPNDHSAYMLRGQLLLLDFGEYKEAAESLRKALSLNPPPQAASLIRIDLARALLAHHDYRGALQVLEPLSDDVSVLVLRAECQWSLGDRELGHKSLANALQLQPDDRHARFLKARWKIEQRDPAQAIEILKGLLKEDPHEHLIRYQLAIAYRLQGDVGQSQAELDRMQASRKLRERLQSLYQTAIKAPTDAQTREEIVRILEELGKPQLAAVWRRALAAVRQAQPATKD